MYWPRTRLYFNKAGKLPWSVDAGTGTREYQTPMITLRAVPGRTVFEPKAGDNKAIPTAWLEFYDCEVVVYDTAISITG